MLAKTYTATHIGLEPIKIEVEVDGNRGTPSFVIIGLASRATNEAKERITSALQNCGVRIRSKRTIVNLAPAEIPKSGACFDLAIAVGLLKMYQEITVDTHDTLFFGELSLDGQVKHVHGALSLVFAAKKWGYKKIYFPTENASELQFISGVTLYPVTHLREVLTALKQNRPLASLKPLPYLPKFSHFSQSPFDGIQGNIHAKRALCIAAAGGHNIILSGPPGTGKTLLAQSLRSILPPLTEQEALEVNQLHSIAGTLQTGFIYERPFRTPHHTTSQSGLIGGGSMLKAGEISLAHRGVLFLDELLEFPRAHLEALRQPLEEKQISFSRAKGCVTYPTNFILVAALNPCPCGYKFSQARTCSCSPQMITRYQEKLSGPLLDRIELRVFVEENIAAVITPSKKTSLSNTREHVAAARQKQLKRFKNQSFSTNSDIPTQELEHYITTSSPAKKILEKAANHLALSPRSYFKVLKVAQTIADLEDNDVVTEKDVTEALQYR